MARLGRAAVPLLATLWLPLFLRQALADEGHGDAHVVASATPAGYVYNPAETVDPFDTIAQDVTKWMKAPADHGIDRRDDGWQDNFCMCLKNGYIASWYQTASFMYVLDTCGAEDGLIMRTGHMQDRHTEILQAAMACDTLKLFSYCFSHHCPEAGEAWEPMCKATHYSVEACDVECSAVAPRRALATFVVASFAAIATSMWHL